ncbi:putative proton-dependent oligopeptide transporter family, MFS transporter superfamily [Helianthus annuus]|nr:putative proton-dependent oligopeptide transporter family, MFS transporter superfamily [Helianthus annuus]
MLVIKSLLRMFPMCGVFFVVSIISATGSAFFLLQYSNLDTQNDMAVQIYSVLQQSTCLAIPFLYRWICCLGKNEKVKIGVGMLCGVVSCIFAWQLEVYRLKEVSHLVDKKKGNTSISFLWLIPQFFVLGCMEGLTREGISKFFTSQLKEEQLQGYQEEYIEFVMGLGKLLNILIILTLKGWLGDTINDSRLDKYYMVLIGVGSVNFIAYCCIARCFYKDQDMADNEFELKHWIEHVVDIEQNQDF